MKARRITAFLLAAVMLMSLIPVGMISVFAEDTTAPATLPDSTAQQLKLAAWADSHVTAFPLNADLAGKAYTVSDNLLGAETTLTTTGDNADGTATTAVTAVKPAANVAGIMVRMKVNGAAGVANNNGFQFAVKVGSDVYVTSSGGMSNSIAVYEYDATAKTWGYYVGVNSHAMRAADNFDGYVFVPMSAFRRTASAANMRSTTYEDGRFISNLLASGISEITVNQSWGKALTVSSVQYVYVEGYSEQSAAYTLPGKIVPQWNIGFPGGAVSTTSEYVALTESALPAAMQNLAYSVDPMEFGTTTTVAHAKFAADATVYPVTNGKPLDGVLGIMLNVNMPSGENYHNNGLAVSIVVNGKTYYNLSYKTTPYSYFRWEGSNKWYTNASWNPVESGALDANRTERVVRYPASFKGTVFIPFDSFSQVYDGDISAYNGTKLEANEVKLTAEELKTHGITSVTPIPTYGNTEMTVSDISFVYPADTVMLTISTADEMVAFLNNIGDYDTQKVVLANDIDMTGKAWPVIEGNGNTTCFAGILDGQGHTISNISIKYSGHYSAPFGVSLTAGKSATFKNLTLSGTVDCGGKWQKGGLYHSVAGDLLVENVINALDVKNTNGDMAGFVASVKAGATATFKNSSVTGYIQGKWSGNVGGFINGNAGTTIIDNCVMAAEVTNTLATHDSTKGGDLGGFAVENSGNLTITNSVMTGSVKHCSRGITNASGAYVGGFLAYLREAGTVTIENCVQMGTVQTLRDAEGTGYTGGFIGQVENNDETVASSIVLKNCSYFGTTQHTKNDAAGFIANGIAESMTLVDCLYAGSVYVGDDLTAETTVETGAFFFAQVAEASLKDCEGNKVATREGMVEMNDKSAFVGADMVADAKTIDSKADFFGYQTKVAEDGKVSVRLVGYTDSLDYDKVGVKYQIFASNATDGNAIAEGVLETTTVYSSVKGETTTYANTDADAVYKDNYFFTFVMENLVTGGDVTIVVTTFHVENDAEVIDETSIVSVDWTVATPEA